MRYFEKVIYSRSVYPEEHYPYLHLQKPGQKCREKKLLIIDSDIESVDEFATEQIRNSVISVETNQQTVEHFFLLAMVKNCIFRKL